MSASRDGKNISVCLLTFNHVNLIESTVKSVLDQNCQGFEFIISDDCSTDGTWELIQKLALHDSRIRPIQTSENLGMAENANFAVKNSTRPHIALLHHDDIYRHDLLEKWEYVMWRHPDIGFVFNPYAVHKSDFVYIHPFKDEKLNGRWFLEKHLFLQWGCPVRGTAMIRRKCWDELGGMRSRFGLLADIDMWMRLASQWPVGYVSEPVIIVRQERPEYYPDIYSGKKWSWLRLKYLYDIHGTNYDEYYASTSISGKYIQFKYRIRVTLETFKWLCYAIVKRNTDMLRTSNDSATKYDLWPLPLIRKTLINVLGNSKQ